VENVQKTRLHPLVAGAAAALIIACAVAVAAMAGYLPGSKAQQNDEQSEQKTATRSNPSSPARVNERTPVRVAAACAECGVVVDVKEVNVMGKGTGVGAVAGGIAGAVIGHEIGDGSRAGTAVGAVVGGVAGHQIERSARSTKRYDISVRMPDGSIKVVSTDTPPGWRPGDKVRLHDGLVKPL
jgi:outer membrane lipoprotein SlyB